ncbi:MAG: hypothetical protein ACT4QC_03410 [Planctomycetaceae bacterium]
MRKLTPLLLVAVAVVLAENSAFAQFGGGGVGSIGGVGGLGGGSPQRRTTGPPTLRRNRSPVLSPALNLLPGINNTFEGQALLRMVPQEQFYNNVQRNDTTFQGVERQIGANRQAINDLSTIQSGLSTTGKSVRFMNTGSYYPSRGGG